MSGHSSFNWANSAAVSPVFLSVTVNFITSPSRGESVLTAMVESVNTGAPRTAGEGQAKSSTARTKVIQHQRPRHEGSHSRNGPESIRQEIAWGGCVMDIIGGLIPAGPLSSFTTQAKRQAIHSESSAGLHNKNPSAPWVLRGSSRFAVIDRSSYRSSLSFFLLSFFLSLSLPRLPDDEGLGDGAGALRSTFGASTFFGDGGRCCTLGGSCFFGMDGRS